MVKDYDHTILGVKEGVLNVRERMIWKSYRRNLKEDREIYMYLGFTQDAWSIREKYKHHWFLVNGEKIIVNNYCLRLLREVNDETPM